MTEQTINRIRKFTADRDWDQFHTPAPENVPNLGTKASGYSGRSYNVGSGSRVVNLYITAKQLTEEDIRMIVRTVNEELGEAI